MVKNLPVQETWVQSLGQEYPLEKGMATHSSILGASLLQISLRSSGHQFQCMWEGERQVSHFDKQFSNTSSVQFSRSVVSNSATSWTAAHQASLSIINSQNLLKLMSIESVMPSNHLILYCPLLFLLSIFPSDRVFSNESTLQIRWPKYWSSSFSLSPSSEYSGLISFRIDWFDLLVV